LRAKQWTDEQIDWHLRTLQVAVNEIFRLWSNNDVADRMPPVNSRRFSLKRPKSLQDYRNSSEKRGKPSENRPPA
jgi:hypothetical protein